MPSKRVIVTIPAYNEEQTIGKVIKEVHYVLGKTKYDYRVLVVDDGSSDRTVDVAKKAGADIFSHKRNLGLVEAFRTEIKKCLELKADIIVHTDADGQYPARYIPGLIKKIEEGNDLVLGSRFSKGLHFSFVKDITNRIFAKALGSMIGYKITDSTTGFRAFNARVAREIELINRFTYTQEQIIRAAKQGLKIAEVPIHIRRTRRSKLFSNPLEYALLAWINIFRIYRDYNPLKFFGTLGILLILAGLLVGALVVYNIVVFGNAGGIPRVILSAMLVLIGLQIIVFGFLADMLKRD